MVGGLIIPECFGEEGVDRAAPGDKLRSWCSRSLNATSFSNLPLPGLNEVTLEGVGCLGGVVGGYLDLGDFDACACVGGELLVLD